MFKKKNRSKKRARAMLSAYSIIMILIILLGVLSHVLPKAKYMAAPVEDDASSVEVGPGEWEGEVPAGESVELDKEKSEGQDEIALPEDESVDPAVGDEVIAGETSEPKASQDSELSSDKESDDAVSGTITDVVSEGADQADEEVIASAGKNTISETFDSLRGRVWRRRCRIVPNTDCPDTRL